MYPDGFGPLSFDDNVLVARINLCGAAFGSVLFALLAGSGAWTIRTIALVVAAGLVLLARHIEDVLPRSEIDPEDHDRPEFPVPYLPPF